MWVVGWVAGSNENITNSAPSYVELGLGTELGNVAKEYHIQSLIIEFYISLVISIAMRTPYKTFFVWT